MRIALVCRLRDPRAFLGTELLEFVDCLGKFSNGELPINWTLFTLYLLADERRPPPREVYLNEQCA